MDKDEWGDNRQVRFLRQVFSQIEEAQRTLLQNLGISLFDERLRRIREGTLRLFEKAWGLSVKRCIPIGERDIVDLYLSSFVYILGRYGIYVPPNTLSPDEKIKSLIQEALK
ncbi:MAG: hypothetical protein N2745_04610 [Syntrophorhabdaceae bacterium]|nr:hypothetical protein [Syntrophorhabdaceae bacterium]